MTIGRALYTLLIGPLELLFESIYVIAFRMIHHPGWSIVFLSLAMNFLVLPLYRQADAKQAEEREREERMRPWIDHIKRTFNGDERFMLLQTYYRQNDYRPTQALAGSFSLLLEVPFFIAAYNFLSNLQLLNGTAFGPIKDLGTPDGLIRAGNVAINVLPVLMTLINMVSAAIYMKGFPLKSKIQMYGIAVVFLVFLYDSPAGLVFYWTLNNLFSLFKNIFYKLKNPGFVLGMLSFAAGVISFAALLIKPLDTVRHQVLAMGMAVLMQIPLIFLIIMRRKGKRLAEIRLRYDTRVFISACFFLALLTGILIPTAVISDSPSEFVSLIDYRTPLWSVAESALLAAGVFLVWFGIFYCLAGSAGRAVLCFSALFISVAAAADYMFFGTGYGVFSSSLQFEEFPEASLTEQLINLLILAAIFVLLIYLFEKKNLLRALSLAMCIAVLGMSGINVAHTVSGLEDIKETAGEFLFKEPTVRLSRKGKNVIVLMLDRAGSAFFPFLLEERPELKVQFAGFTYYPNTISFGKSTNVGAPALFGGYEYDPESMNERSDMLLEEKHNEALKMLPVLFLDNGYDVTVFDPPYAGYKWIPDLSIYSDYPEIRRFITKGKFSLESSDKSRRDTDRGRRFFCYSVFKIAPTVMQPALYGSGSYNLSTDIGANDVTGQVRKGLSVSSGYTDSFLDPYYVLCALPSITEIIDSDQDTFLMMENDTTHDAMLLREPEYEPAFSVDNTEYDRKHQVRLSIDGMTAQITTEYDMIHYHANMAAMIQLGRWMDCLRENGVYDNTRIIIVSDHGGGFKSFEQSAYGGDADQWNPLFHSLLLFKDFEDNSFSVDNAFMTVADTPVLSVTGLIADPVNPFTGVPITSDEKKGDQMILEPGKNGTDVDYNNGYVFLPGRWFSVHDDYFDLECWKDLGEY